MGNMENKLFDIHEHYMDIINCMPDAVYWVDADCNLKGFNSNFLKLLGIKDVDNYSLQPYPLFVKYAKWPKSRVDNLRIDDMSVISSGKSKYNVEEDPVILNTEQELHYLSTRVPLLDKNKNIVGLVVILMDVAINKVNKESHAKKLNQELSLLDRCNGRSPKVLIVEDNLIAQKLERQLLHNLNCEVDVAGTGEEALAKFFPGKYDVVFMDIGLQDTSGYMLAKKIRELENGTENNVPIIALTAYEADTVKSDCLEYFMAGAMTKPLTCSQAEQVIQHYVYNQDVMIEGLSS